MKSIFWAILIGVSLLAVPSKAQENMCGPYEAIQNSLTIAHEIIVWNGKIGKDYKVEIWAKVTPPQSWTLLIRHESGMACIKAMGDGWEMPSKSI